jgi:signal transduction histidine kinase
VTDIHAARGPWKAARFLPLLLTPVLLLASTFPGEYRVPVAYWALALAVSLLYPLAGRWPLVISVAISALTLPMFVIEAWGPSDLVRYLGAIALVEVIVRCNRRSAALATGLWAAAVVIGMWNSPTERFVVTPRLVDAGTLVVLPVLLGLYLRAQRELTRSLRSRAAEVETRTRADERTALARELHDLVAHHMASIVLRVKVARRVATDADPQMRAVLDDVHDTAAGALADIRRLLTALRDTEPDGVVLVEPDGVRDEMLAAVDRVRAAGFTVHTHIDADAEGLDAIGRLTLLRLIQESLTNVMKHADSAVPVELSVTQSDSGVDARVHSGGRVHGGTASYGIIGMRERVRLAGGTLEAGADESGWQVSAHLPAIPTAVGR